jgi:hypothetical protein
MGMESPSKAELKRTLVRTLIVCGVLLLGVGLWIVRDQLYLLVHRISLIRAVRFSSPDQPAC